MNGKNTNFKNKKIKKKRLLQQQQQKIFNIDDIDVNMCKKICARKDKN